MARRVVGLPALASALLCVALLSGPGFGAARAAMGAATVQQTMAAGPYRLALKIGPLEHMYTEAQVKSMHPKDGEVMVSGTMVMGGGMDMGGPMPNHHLEVHAITKSTGKPVTKGMVSITIRSSAGKLLTKVPIAWMYGIKEGVSDTHFGNNVSLKNGNYKVVVQVDSTSATFSVMLGGSGMSM